MSDISEYLNILPNDFCHIIYWYLNDDLQTVFNINDSVKLIEHWINNGQRENRQYNIPKNIIQHFDNNVYTELYDDIRDNITNYTQLIVHYYRYGIHEGRIASTNEIFLPSDFDESIDSIDSIDIYTQKIKYIKLINYEKKDQKFSKSYYNIDNISNNDIIIRENPNIFFIMNCNSTSTEQFIDFISNLHKYDFIDYYYFCESDEIMYHYIYNIKNNNNLLYSDLKYDKSIKDINCIDKTIILHKSFVENLLDTYDKSLINNKQSIYTNFLKVLSHNNIKHHLPLLFIFETDDIDFNYMFQTWIKNIKNYHNIKIIIISKQNIKFNSFDNNKYDFIYFFKTDVITSKEINYLYLLFFIRSKKIYSDWIIFSRKKLCMNIENIYNTVIKWYNYDLLFNQNIYIFKSIQLEHLINYFINMNYNCFIKYTNYDTRLNNNIGNIINVTKYSDCLDKNTSDFLLVLV